MDRISARNRPILAVTLVSAAVLCLAGCVERTLVIRSDPSGARTFLDGREIGTTPFETPFTWYGKRDILLIKAAPSLEESFDPEARAYNYSGTLELKRPGHQTPGIDVFSDLINPTKIEDRQEFDFKLEPVPIDEDDEAYAELLLERAEELRTRSQTPIEEEEEGP